MDPARLLSDAGVRPDPWQADLLRSDAGRMLLLSRARPARATTAAGLALKAALLEPGSLVLLLSPTLRQSGELFRDKVVRLFDALGRPVPATQESALTMRLANGSRVVSLPGEESTIRGYSGVRLLVIDEGARVADELYRAVRPMLAVSGGRLVGLSTPFGRRGWFHEEWEGKAPWKRVRIAAEDCPRITPEFLAEEAPPSAIGGSGKSTSCSSRTRSPPCSATRTWPPPSTPAFSPWPCRSDSPMQACGFRLPETPAPPSRSRAACWAWTSAGRPTSWRFAACVDVAAAGRAGQAAAPPADAGGGRARRWPLGTSYAAVAEWMAAFLKSPADAARYGPPPLLVVDETGVGSAVVEMLVEAVRAAG